MTDTIKPAEATRVMLPDGIGMPPFRAMQIRHDVPTIVFIRDDEWSLAAYPDSEAIAYQSWRDKWVEFARGPEWVRMPIEVYRS